MVVYVQEHLKAQRAVVLVLKRLRRRDHGLKSHLTDWDSRESNSGLLGTRLLTSQRLTACDILNKTRKLDSLRIDLQYALALKAPRKKCI